MAKRKTLFDDKPVEIAELTYVIKQDLSSINSQIGNLQALVRSQHPTSSKSGEGQEGEHAKNVVVMLQGKLADVSVGFKEVLEVRTKNIQASRSRTENFVSNVAGRVGEGEFRLRKNPSTPAGEGSLSMRMLMNTNLSRLQHQLYNNPRRLYIHHLLLVRPRICVQVLRHHLPYSPLTLIPLTRNPCHNSNSRCLKKLNPSTATSVHDRKRSRRLSELSASWEEFSGS